MVDGLMELETLIQLARRRNPAPGCPASETGDCRAHPQLYPDGAGRFQVWAGDQGQVAMKAVRSPLLPPDQTAGFSCPHRIADFRRGTIYGGG